ncbi:hypothetical protein F503_06902 [Ophiostoma piceae UAMH 11346]|uniref:Uncharacterized protein n=1 Tax=Ophiostoma piceae (strain UAMH 11346) TaxID=1262450 RepID=S3CB16_OPHP1|nr:hypothetical protein F503_06902 [Ophiostoma piceae UAMH 11346]
MSSAIGRLQAALANVTNEVTVAAANLNFDFTLVKYEVPREYEPIGKLLSPFRKREAETGTTHVTARRLAALFADICPPSPALIKAYGKRASEIVQESANEVSKEHYASIFSAYAGIDATSMWAAATSSSNADGGAVQIHLLACLLASAFEASHAISIWSQIVEIRRTEIATRVTNGETVHISLASAAAQAEIPRKQLAEWDMSARSWLETADTIRSREKKQYDDVLRRIDITANASEDLYENVMGVWKTAIGTMNNLVAGIPQDVQDGATVIGLKAWHLYPDTEYFGAENGHVNMNDPLIPKTGILSIGCSGSADSSKSGVSWSLSLAHLKFYGDPIHITSTVHADPSRLTTDEFRLVMLGSIMRMWNIAPSQETAAIRVLAVLAILFPEYMTSKGRKDLKSHFYVFSLLEKAEAYFRTDEARSSIFINLGKNRPQFRPQRNKDRDGGQNRIRPFFGLLDKDTFLSCLKRPEDRIRALLWRCADRRELLCERGAIIRYTEDGKTITIVLVADANAERSPRFVGHPVVYMQWLESDVLKPVVLEEEPSTIAHGDRQDIGIGKELPILTKRVDTLGLDGEATAMSSEAVEAKPGDENNHNKDQYNLWSNEDGDEGDEDGEDQYILGPNVVVFHRHHYLEYFGDARYAAMFVPAENSDLVWPRFEMEDLARALYREVFALGDQAFKDLIMDPLFSWLARFEFSLQALQFLPGPIINIEILRDPSRCQPNWIASKFHDPLLVALPVYYSPAETFSILALYLAQFEAPPSGLDNSISGLSFGDSIYVPTELLHDPLVSKIDKRPGVTRILGNVGRPGLVIFSSVAQPMVPPDNNVVWRFTDLHTFDGTPDNYFKNTSMHLNFTEFEASMNTASSHGNRDIQFLRKESVVTIRDRGEWISDVDVVAALKSHCVYVLPPQEPCSHLKMELGQNSSLRAIRSWGELCEVQTGVAVVQVHGDWLMRLAVTAFLAQRAMRQNDAGFRITLMPEDAYVHHQGAFSTSESQLIRAAILYEVSSKVASAARAASR